MKTSFLSRIATIGFAIFAMLFGAGNLIFPLHIGLQAGQNTLVGFLGFALTGVILPVLGLVAMVTFDGDYDAFFGRLGSRVGQFFIFLSMLIIGPFIAMPRIITLSYEVLYPFLPTVFTSLNSATLLFALVFVGGVFLITSRPGKLLDVIGKFLSPAMLIGLAIFIVSGLTSGSSPGAVSTHLKDIFINSFRTGYGTLDVLGAIFFSSIIVTLLSKYSSKNDRMSVHQAAVTAGVAGALGGFLLGAVYLGVTYLSAFHGTAVEGYNLGAIFINIAIEVLGTYGAALISTIVLLAGFTTIVALAAVVGEYLQVSCGKRVSYLQSVAAVLFTTALIASMGLDRILAYSAPYIEFFYPLVIVTMLCNLAYKLVGFKYIKAPVALTALLMLVMHFIA